MRTLGFFLALLLPNFVFSQGIKTAPPVTPALPLYMPSFVPFGPPPIVSSFAFQGPGFSIIRNQGFIPGFGYANPWGWYPPIFFPPTPKLPPPVPTIPNLVGGSTVMPRIPATKGTATLIIELPSSGTITLNGKTLNDTKSLWILTSPEIPLNTEYRFAWVAEWDRDGQTYQAKDQIDVLAGKEKRHLVIAGLPIRK